MSFSKEAAVGFFVMLGLVCVAYLTVKLGRMEVFHSEGYVLTASFNSVSGLVKTSGLIGDKYISLEPGGSGEPLKNGDEITDTESAVDIESLISKYVFGKV